MNPYAVVIVLLPVLVIAGVALLMHRGARRAERKVFDTLRGLRPPEPQVRFDASSLAGLPPPVRRYFLHVLHDGQPMVRTAELAQSGRLKTDGASDEWMTFAARALAVPARGFAWRARVAMSHGMHAQVLDAFVDGRAQGRVSLMGVLKMASARNTKELDSGALHRYLAEAVWFPAALLPQAGVHWTPIDEHRALATVRIGDVSVSLEFRFNARDEVETVFSPARWGSFHGGYRQAPWEGHFGTCFVQDGMRIPRHGEVGWYAGDELQLVWQGEIEQARFTFCGEGAS